MTSRRKHDKSRRRSDLAEYRTFSDNFILTPHKSVHTDYSGLLKLHNEYNRTFPILKVAKSTVPIWGVKDVPTLKGIPNIRYQPRSHFCVSRDDTFDVDFSMPKEIREVLEEEGLEKKVINRAIGRSELKQKMMKKMIKGEPPPRESDDMQPRLKVVLPPIISTTKQVSKYNGTESSSWLDLSRQPPIDFPRIALWENPIMKSGEDDHLPPNFGRDMRNTIIDAQVEMDKKEWQAAKHVEEICTGDNFSPPRIVLISSKVPKCHLLSQVYQKDVIPILYDFDSCTFTEILDAIAKKLNAHRRNCKAKSVMVLCQGGPGYIYLLKNFAITPQKLHKPSYRSVVGFWRALAGMISKLNTEDATIHVFGFNMLENQQGKALLTILQSLMYPNLVKIEVANDDTEAGRAILEQYFIYRRYQVWKTYQRSSFNDIDISRENPGPVKRHFRVPVMRVAR